MACRTAACLLCCAVAALASWTGVGSATAQSDACILGPEQILRCGGELTTPGTVYHPAAAGEDGLPPSVQLDSGALLIEFHAKDTATLRHDFQILTPQVVASVRGTKWMMEVKPGQTSAVVLLGQVAIARKDAADAVMVGPGRGVDVTAADPAKISKSKNGSQLAPIAVKRWAPARVKALLARFGQ
jgi:FecR protein